MENIKPQREEVRSAFERAGIPASPEVVDGVSSELSDPRRRDHGRVMRTLEGLGNVASEAGVVRPSDSQIVHHPENTKAPTRVPIKVTSSAAQEVPVHISQA